MLNAKIGWPPRLSGVEMHSEGISRVHRPIILAAAFLFGLSDIDELILKFSV